MADSSVANSDTLLSGVKKIGTVELLFEAAVSMKLQPNWIIPNGLFAVNVNGTEKYVNFARSSLNSDISVSLIRNKYLTRCILERHGMNNIPFTKATTLDEAISFLHTHKKIIAKPIHGSGSRDIHIITASYELETLDIRSYILEKYIAGTEIRYLVLNDGVIAVHESDYGDSVKEDRALKRISYPKENWDPALISASLRIMGIFNLGFAAVDYMIDASGHAYILEVNSVPGLKWFHAPSEGPAVDVAGHFMNAILPEHYLTPIEREVL